MLRFALCALAAFGAASSDSVQRGREIFHTGHSPNGTPITALIAGGTQPIDAALVPCANCHGADGRGGKIEGGARPADISPQTLAQAAELPQRRRAAYTPALLKRAITLGYDASGNALDRAMPRFALSQRDVQDLIAYLGVLERENPPGVSDTELHIVLLGAPTLDAPATPLYGRRIELLRAPNRDALLTIDARDDADESIRSAEGEQVPTIALQSVHAAPSSYAFVLTSGEDDRIAALRRYARTVQPSLPAQLFADDCRDVAATDPNALVLLTARAAANCDLATIPPAFDRRTFVAAAFPPDRHDALAHAALDLALTALADLGRDFTRDALRDALERASLPPVAGFPALAWSRERHVALERAWLMTLDLRAGMLLATPGWSDVAR